MPSRARRLWKDRPRDERRPMRSYFRALDARYGPFRDAVVFEHARLTTEAWWAAAYASGVAIVEIGNRQRGRGRRPNHQAIDRRLKRAGLGSGTLDQMLRRLEELAGKNGQSLDLARAIAAQTEAPRP
jgi:hypothetical protein